MLSAASKRVTLRRAEILPRHVVHQASHRTDVQLPSASTLNERAPKQQAPQQANHEQHRHDAFIYPTAPRPADRRLPVYGRTVAPVQQQSGSMPNRKVRPSRMEFETMYQQLCAWKQCYMTAHVPRYCFDAPELGAWVRKMRKQYADKKLEQWKVERLNQLSFEWQLTDQDAKWHHLYHELRRYQLLHGTTNVDLAHNEEDGCDWHQVAWWLKKQARLLAKRKLSGHRRDMLALLGVTLRVPKRIITRTAQLQALNGPERRKLRKKWKKLDFAAADKLREQRDLERQQQQEQQRQQQEIVERRLMLLRDTAEEGTAGSDAQGGEFSDLVNGGLDDPSSRSSSSSSSSSSVGETGLQQYYAQLGVQLPDSQQQHQWEEDGFESRYTKRHGRRHNNGGRGARRGRSQGLAQVGSSSSSSSSTSRPPDLTDGPLAAVDDDAPSEQVQTTVEGRQAEPATGQQQQQQQHQQRPPGVLYQRNRRYRRLGSSTRQERWMLEDYHS